MGNDNDKLREELLTAVAVALAALFFATVITLLIARYYKSLKACCQRCCAIEEAEKTTYKTNSDKKAPFKSMMEGTKGSSVLAPMFLSTQNNPFTIPGSFSSQQIQPELKYDKIDDEEYVSYPFKCTSSSDTMSDTPLLQRRPTSSTVSLPANFSPMVMRRATGSGQQSITYSSEEEDTLSALPNGKSAISIEDLMFLNIRPELYDISRRKTVGKGNLGKIHISFQYEDKLRRKLDLFINNMNKLQFSRPDITGIYASIVLLPERESIYTTKQHAVTPNPGFEERFVFSSKPMNRDFESKTALILVHYIDRSSKDIIYGEARIPLLSREIYSQVPTDVTLNIKTASMQSEFGDLLIQLVYSESGTLSVMVKMIKVPSSMSLENMSGLRVKSYMKKLGNRFGRKHSLVCSISDSNQHMIELNGEFQFKVPKDQFTDYDLNCAVFGKHKILGKKLNLGKASIGYTGRDETGNVHWRTILNSPGVAWSVWHPIYNC